MNASELIKERADLLSRIEEINAALAMLGNPAAAIKIETRRNLRNTYVLGVAVYADAELTKEAHSADHGGFVTAEDAALLQARPSEVGLDELVWLGSA